MEVDSRIDAPLAPLDIPAPSRAPSSDHRWEWKVLKGKGEAPRCFWETRIPLDSVEAFLLKEQQRFPGVEFAHEQVVILYCIKAAIT